ncbi:MAG: hypothetical protein KIT09_33760 [Bryobacteraceae bacterium]|nr:hypothetical protein [Bryobacteraceae bacterium]
MHSLMRILLVLAVLSAAGARAPEPSYEQAVARWPDFRRPIVYLGCKDHPDEFGVMWNGNLTLASRTMTAADQRLFRARADDSLQVSFSMGDKPDFANREAEDGTSEASLAEGYLPITEIRLRKGGVTLVQEAFATNAQGGCTAQAWDEPVFLRVRFRVEDPGTGAGPVRLWAQLAGNHTRYEMDARRNVRIAFAAPPYARKLEGAGNTVRDERGMVVVRASRLARFHGQLPDSLNSVALREWQLDRNLAEYELPREKGAALELIVPFLPASEGAIGAAARLDHGQAREALAGCWNGEIGRGMQIRVPEEPLNNLWRYNAPMSFMTADRYPNGDYVLKTSSHHYEAYWPTPGAMNMVALAQQGYRDEVKAYLEPFLDKQRYRPVPNTGASFLSSRGFISGPSEHVLISWVGDHGAILWAASEYYLLTRDKAFLDRWLPSMLEGLEWIAREREYTKVRGGRAAGLMPAGRATDDDRQAYFVWVDGWIYRGLASVCRVLEAIGHQDAARWTRERDDYRAAFQKALRDQIQRTFQWTDRGGVRIPFVPWELDQTNADYLHFFYLDCGPMFLGVSGLEDASDDTMTWVLKYLTEGPGTGRANPDWTTYSDRPSLRFEMSTVEPCYSWNVNLRFLRNEREKFLEGFYSQAAGAVSRRFLGGSEHRDGIQQLPVMNAVINGHLRNMLVFENDGGGLDLLRNAPSVWLREGKEIDVRGAETYFGPLRYHVRAAGGRVEAEIETPSRERPQSIRLHVYHPEGRPLRAAAVNGTAVAPVGPSVVEVKDPAGLVKVTAEF